MPFPYYTAERQEHARQSPVEIEAIAREEETHPAEYMPDPGLVDAVNVALILGQPLLLTGEPGTGKTQLAHHLAWKLGLFPALKFETKSTSTARDLFYTYDTIGRFQAAQIETPRQAGGVGLSEEERRAEQARQAKESFEVSKKYITFNALGRAILRAAEKDVTEWLREDSDLKCRGRQSVVLIDEIDKASRDFPNDILNEIDGMFFRVPELNNHTFKANDRLRPIVVLTSNAEKNLPDAFLRRCAYYNIPFPEDRLGEIVKARIKAFRQAAEGRPGNKGEGSAMKTDDNPKLLEDALDFFFELRKPAARLHKKPATAEFLGWLRSLLAMGAKVDGPLGQIAHINKQTRRVIDSSLSALTKSADDQALAFDALRRWLEQRP